MLDYLLDEAIGRNSHQSDNDHFVYMQSYSISDIYSQLCSMNHKNDNAELMSFHKGLLFRDLYIGSKRVAR